MQDLRGDRGQYAQDDPNHHGQRFLHPVSRQSRAYRQRRYGAHSRQETLNETLDKSQSPPQVLQHTHLMFSWPDFLSPLSAGPSPRVAGKTRGPSTPWATKDGPVDQRQIPCILSVSTPSYVMNAQKPSVGQKGRYE